MVSTTPKWPPSTAQARARLTVLASLMQYGTSQDSSFPYNVAYMRGVWPMVLDCLCCSVRWKDPRASLPSRDLPGSQQQFDNLDAIPQCC